MTAIVNTNLAMLLLLNKLHDYNIEHDHKTYNCQHCADYLKLSQSNRELVKEILESIGDK